MIKEVIKRMNKSKRRTQAHQGMVSFMLILRTRLVPTKGLHLHLHRLHLPWLWMMNPASATLKPTSSQCQIAPITPTALIQLIITRQHTLNLVLMLWTTGGLSTSRHSVSRSSSRPQLNAKDPLLRWDPGSPPINSQPWCVRSFQMCSFRSTPPPLSFLLC